MTSTKLLLACGSLIGVIACADVAAQNYPVKPVRIIVPTPAGGNPDFIARPVAQKMSESLRQTFIIDNRPGAAGTIGVELATRAVPEVRDLFERAGIIPVGSTPEQFAQQVRSDIAKFGKVAREAGIRAE
ncbi:MAG: hypothetical protein HYY77_02455 [Betaproteobacteria bacterium]|nr:hypothetical protein [Betaproteobacteria bacterium]